MPPHGHLQNLQTVLPVAGIIPAIQHIFHKFSPNFDSSLKDLSGSFLVLPSALEYCFRNSVSGHSHKLTVLQRRKAFFFPVGLLQRLKQGPGIFI